MMGSALPTASVIAAEDGLIGHIRQLAEIVSKASRVPEGWSYQNPYQLLMTLGRRFTPVASPDDLIGMPARLCYSNSARYAQAHRDEGVVYAEGFSLTHAGIDVYLPHAWVVRPDGTVLDPTWHDAPGRAYVGIPVKDFRLWPFEGGGLLQDFRRTLPLLRDGIPPSALADLGRPLSPSEHP
ncbi:hypothetical protein [Streptomyces sp. NPDC058757]|uniref:hypothetical protein n=1 Tax=Streptomyces sp. NPDC058757 TaxID=3346626 RepID=UPI0036CD0317